MNRKYTLVGLGAALVDMFADIDDAQLDALGSVKASMSLVSSDAIADLQKRVVIHTQAAGGATANSCVGVARLGLKSAFFGKTSDDAAGTKFRHDMRRFGIDMPAQVSSQAPTGRCLVLVSDDAERTMHTDLGASPYFTPQDLDMSILADAAIFYTEGYIYDWSHGASCFEQAAQAIHKAGGQVAFSLADRLCVARHYDAFRALLKAHIDILCANIAEAEALFGTRDGEKIHAYCQDANIEAVITRSEKGAWCIAGDEFVETPAIRVLRPVDLTGAGDQFAAGYLSARARGYDLRQAGNMGALAASEVIRHFGPQPQSDLKALFLQHGFSNFA